MEYSSSYMQKKSIYTAKNTLGSSQLAVLPAQKRKERTMGGRFFRSWHLEFYLMTSKSMHRTPCLVLQ